MKSLFAASFLMATILSPTASANICDRTPFIVDAIIEVLGYKQVNLDCENVTAEHLASIHSIVVYQNMEDKPVKLKHGDFAGLVNLRELDLSYGRLAGTILPELGSLAQLQILYLDHNNFSGAIPPELGKLAQLQILYLGNNNLSGTIPTELGELTQLRELFLQNNKLSGNIPPELGELAELERVSFNGNNLSEEIPAGLKDKIIFTD